MDVRLSFDGRQCLFKIEESGELRQPVHHPRIRAWTFHRKFHREPLMRNAVSQRVGIEILPNAGRWQK